MSSLGLPFRGGRVFATALALSRLGHFGLGSAHPAVRKGAEFLFSRQRGDGSWPLSESFDEEGRRYSMMPLQTAFPLGGLARAGFATDPRAEKAYDWLLGQRLPDGAWPTGVAAGVRGFVGGYRRLPHSRWGCRSNTAASLICLAHHPRRRSHAEARQALDHLLARETRDRSTLGFETARLVGFEEARGFITFHAAFDPALVLDLSARVGIAAAADERIMGFARFVEGLAGPRGLWEYAPRPDASRWVSHGILRSLKALGKGQGEWQSLEPRTPFRAYPRQRKRY